MNSQEHLLDDQAQHYQLQAEPFDAIVVGGGPAGATAAMQLARQGRKVLLLDQGGRAKPCGGAIPPRLIRDYDIPDHLLVAKARCARMISPLEKKVDIPIEGGFVGMVDRGPFDEWLRERAAQAGATRLQAKFESLGRSNDLNYVDVSFKESKRASNKPMRLFARTIIGADGARSAVAKHAMPELGEPKSVFAYHEIVRAPAPATAGFDGSRCDVIYQGRFSPDFYAWVFPHGNTVSIGTGSAHKGFSLRHSVESLRSKIGLHHCETLRKEGAPLPLKPLKRWDDGHSVLLAGDAAGVVAPSSGEGIYYAMLSGELSANAVHEFLSSGQASALAQARKQFMKKHQKVFWVLGIMQWFWYQNDRRRERFVKMCEDKDVQRLTFEAYMNKELVRREPMAHVKIFFKDMAHLLGLAKT